MSISFSYCIMNDMKKDMGSIYIILSAILFGMMPLFTKVGYAYGANAYTIAFGRFLSGSFFCWVYLKSKRITFHPNKKEWIELFKLSLFYASTPILLYTSYTYIGSGLATTLHFTYPIVVIFYLAFFFHKKIDLKQGICTILCLVGILLLYQPNGNMDIRGILIAIVSGFLYAGYIVVLGKSPVKEYNPFILTFWISFLSSIEIGCMTVLSGHFVMLHSFIVIICMICLGFTATFLALALFQKGMVTCGEVKSSLLSTFEPITSVFVGILFFQEALTIKEFFGIVCILFATILLVLKKKG